MKDCDCSGPRQEIGDFLFCVKCGKAISIIMKDKSYTVLELEKLHKEYRKEGFAKYNSYYGLQSSGHFTTDGFIKWLKKKEEK